MTTDSSTTGSSYRGSSATDRPAGARRVTVVNGPNLNLLGLRDPAVYGTQSLADVEERCRVVGGELGLEVEVRHSNHEGVLVDWVQEVGAAARAGESVGMVLNAGAYTHTSIALRDAISGSQCPVVEVHISNVHAREGFRHVSHLSPVAAGVVVGFGVDGYELALRGLALRAARTRG